MESVISIKFAVESEAYQALTELKKNPVNSKYVISQAGLVKNMGGRIVPQDAFDTGIETANDAFTGGLIGSLFGILGGPIGMLLTGSVGALAGSIVDTGEAARNLSLMEKVSEQFRDGDVAIVALAQENEPGGLEEVLSKFQVSVVRESAAEVAVAVKEAQELQKELEKEARKKLREDKKEERKRNVEEHRAKIKQDFESLTKKFSHKG